jgi:repressor LexA
MRLTPKQKEILDFISAFGNEQGYAPSQQEIARHFGFKSLGTVQNYLVRLERAGALQKTWNARRSLSVVPPQPSSTATLSGNSSLTLPLLGRVAAGRPIEAIDAHDTVEVPPSMIQKGEHFALKVVGQSMIEDGILDGDLVVVKKQKHAENGQTVVALLDNEATVKRYYKKGDAVELHPANPAYRPIVIQSIVEFSIEGVVVGVIRVLPQS